MTRITARGLVWLGVSLLILSAWAYMPGQPYLEFALLLALLGCGTLGLAQWRAPALGLPGIPVTLPVADRPVGWGRVGVAVALLALLTLRNRPQPGPLLGMNIHVQVALLLLAIILLLMGGAGLGWRDAQLVGRWLKHHRREALAVAGIVLLALGVRAYQLGDAVRAFMDEGPFMEAVVTLRTDPAVSILTPMHPVASSTYLFPYTQYVMAALFGSTLTQFRMAAVLYGVLTVALLYGLARALFDRPVALASALLLAVFPPHIHMSRIGIYNIADPVPGLAALLGLTLAWRTGRRGWFVLSGVMLGLLPYYYEGGELLYPALGLGWGAALWLFNRGRLHWRGVRWLAASALVVALPVYLTSWAHHLPLFTRLDDTRTGADVWLPLLLAPNGFNELLIFWRERLLPPLLHYVHAPDASLFYSGDTALILPYLVPAFLAGVAYSLRRTYSLIIPLWLLLTVLGNSLINYPNWTARFVVVMPAVSIACALGLRYCLPVMMGARWRHWLAGTLFLLSVAQVGYYFGQHLPLYNTRIIHLRRHYNVAFRVMALPQQYSVYFNFDDGLQLPFSEYLLQYMGDEHAFYGVRLVDYDLASLDPNGQYAFFIHAGDAAALRAIGWLWELDGPHYDDASGIPRDEQYGLYYATPWRRREVESGA